MTTKIAEGVDPATREVEEDVKLAGDEERPRADRESEAEGDAAATRAEDDNNQGQQA